MDQNSKSVDRRGQFESSLQTYARRHGTLHPKPPRGCRPLPSITMSANAAVLKQVGDLYTSDAPHASQKVRRHEEPPAAERTLAAW